MNDVYLVDVIGAGHEPACLEAPKVPDERAAHATAPAVRPPGTRRDHSARKGDRFIPLCLPVVRGKHSLVQSAWQCADLQK